MAPALPAAYRSGVAAMRAAVLAVHAAAGLTQTLDAEALRLARVAEGLVRAAVARLEHAARHSAEDPADTTLGAGARTRSKPRRRRRGKGKRAGSNGEDGAGDVQMASGANASTAPPAPLGCDSAVPPAVRQPLADIDNYIEGAELALAATSVGVVDLAVAASGSAAALAAASAPPSSVAGSCSTSSRPKTRFWCSCQYSLPLSKRHKCGGCGWQWTKADLSLLRSETAE